MPEIFPPSSNSIARALIFGTPLVLVSLVASLYALEWSPWATRAWAPIAQPVQFSHKHHAGQLGIDCRYCHTGVEKSRFAGIPPTETCMTCHSQLYTDQALLAPVRESLAQNRPIVWNRVHDLPDFVYFNHAIHLNKGIGCVACHGRTGKEMNLTWQDQTLYMAWCLQCHRHPDQHIAPKGQVFDINWQPLADHGRTTEARQLVKAYDVQSSGRLTDCYTCHR
jgi:hypothetical protein